MNKYIKKIGDAESISLWASKRLSDKVIKPYDNSLGATLKHTGKRMYVKFNGSCLEQDKITFNHGEIVNIYIVYDLKSNLNNFDPTLILTKNNDIDKYNYSGYGIRFDSKGTFSDPSGGSDQNVIIYRANMSSSAHASNKTKRILILGEGFTQGLEDTRLYAEKMYSINFTTTKKKFCLSLHYNGRNSYLFLNGTEIIKFKAKDSETLANHYI